MSEVLASVTKRMQVSKVSVGKVSRQMQWCHNTRIGMWVDPDPVQSLKYSRMALIFNKKLNIDCTGYSVSANFNKSLITET